ncbi:RNA-binding S4 domain-containing protein [Rhodoferax sp. 4810]|uniref:Heat shock protein 15 n=1 Tax=Thiospirillum jenense TaxID=1653858 RepID=A0A839H3Z8_9GAMM|nr:S4 domain-containing protein [Thiospirillum jenense]MBB1073198.1 RNA-binding S4 domain-containing protein [Rhodoferax jenense]MBB1124641.1 RNA-binding S4 domain-containing protein [Thiospirillum jenense]
MSKSTPIEQRQTILTEQRLDKWLWVARFFKTRQLAIAAINGGKIKVDEQRCKPSRLVRPGSRIQIQKGILTWQIEVLTLPTQRRPAAEAIQCYCEAPASQEARQALIQSQRDTGHYPHITGQGRPTKRDRRQLDALIDSTITQ